MRAAIINPRHRYTKASRPRPLSARRKHGSGLVYIFPYSPAGALRCGGIQMSEQDNDGGRNRRRHLRTKLRARIKLKHANGEVIVETGDISDGGVFIEANGVELPPVGTEVKVQVQDLPVEAPELSARIVRMEANGVGLEFILP
jgi:hypothetical protein